MSVGQGGGQGRVADNPARGKGWPHLRDVAPICIMYDERPGIRRAQVRGRK